MKIKNLLLLFTFFCSCIIFAQDVHGPDVIATGKFVKKTIPLRDMPVRKTIEKEETSNLKIIQNFTRNRMNRYSDQTTT